MSRLLRRWTTFALMLYYLCTTPAKSCTPTAMTPETSASTTIVSSSTVSPNTPVTTETVSATPTTPTVTTTSTSTTTTTTTTVGCPPLESLVNKGVGTSPAAMQDGTVTIEEGLLILAPGTPPQTTFFVTCDTSQTTVGGANRILLTNNNIENPPFPFRLQGGKNTLEVAVGVTCRESDSTWLVARHPINDFNLGDGGPFTQIFCYTL